MLSLFLKAIIIILIAYIVYTSVTRNIVKYKVSDFGKLPSRANKTDAGIDLRTPSTFTLPPHSSKTINTRVCISIPKGYCGLILPKSGLNVNHNIMAFGVVDAGYTGEIIVQMYNFGDEEYTFKSGDKITQMVITSFLPARLEVTNDLKGCGHRGTKGFGSSGK